LPFSQRPGFLLFGSDYQRAFLTTTVFVATNITPFIHEANCCRWPKRKSCRVWPDIGPTRAFAQVGFRRPGLVRAAILEQRGVNSLTLSNSPNNTSQSGLAGMSFVPV